MRKKNHSYVAAAGAAAPHDEHEKIPEDFFCGKEFFIFADWDDFCQFSLDKTSNCKCTCYFI